MRGSLEQRGIRCGGVVLYTSHRGAAVDWDTHAAKTEVVPSYDPTCARVRECADQGVNPDYAGPMVHQRPARFSSEAPAPAASDAFYAADR